MCVKETASLSGSLGDHVLESMLEDQKCGLGCINKSFKCLIEEFVLHLLLAMECSLSWRPL